MYGRMTKAGIESSRHCGAEGSRNPDLFDANEALYQLSYSPMRCPTVAEQQKFTLARAPVKRNFPGCRQSTIRNDIRFNYKVAAFLLAPSLPLRISGMASRVVRGCEL